MSAFLDQREIADFRCETRPGWEIDRRESVSGLSFTRNPIGLWETNEKRVYEKVVLHKNFDTHSLNLNSLHPEAVLADRRPMKFDFSSLLLFRVSSMWRARIRAQIFPSPIDWIQTNKNRVFEEVVSHMERDLESSNLAVVHLKTLLMNWKRIISDKRAFRDILEGRVRISAEMMQYELLHLS